MAGVAGADRRHPDNAPVPPTQRPNDIATPVAMARYEVREAAIMTTSLIAAPAFASDAWHDRGQSQFTETRADPSRPQTIATASYRREQLGHILPGFAGGFTAESPGAAAVRCVSSVSTLASYGQNRRPGAYCLRQVGHNMKAPGGGGGVAPFTVGVSPVWWAIAGLSGGGEPGLGPPCV